MFLLGLFSSTLPTVALHGHSLRLAHHSALCKCLCLSQIGRSLITGSSPPNKRAQLIRGLWHGRWEGEKRRTKISGRQGFFYFFPPYQWGMLKLGKSPTVMRHKAALDIVHEGHCSELYVRVCVRTICRETFRVREHTLCSLAMGPLHTFQKPKSQPLLVRLWIVRSEKPV